MSATQCTCEKRQKGAEKDQEVRHCSSLAENLSRRIKNVNEANISIATV